MRDLMDVALEKIFKREGQGVPVEVLSGALGWDGMARYTYLAGWGVIAPGRKRTKKQVRFRFCKRSEVDAYIAQEMAKSA